MVAVVVDAGGGKSGVVGLKNALAAGSVPISAGGVGNVAEFCCCS